ncbi:MAG: hypothetical protein IEMM0006_0660 [bacterium]|nr:MAG: hypothetical protein IEMM0006_0660 [bacterium]
MGIKYNHQPAGKLITALNDSTTTVHLKSNGYNLLDLLLHGSLDSLNVDLRQHDIKKDADGQYFINTGSLRESTAQQLGVNDRDIEFSKSKLSFSMELLHKRKMKVSALLDLTFKSQFRLYHFKIIPATITVYGPDKIMDTLKGLNTAMIHLENLENSQKVKVKIHNPYPRMLRFLPPKVTVDLDVERYTERSVQIPVDVSEIRPEIRTFPNIATVNFNVFIRDYEKIRANQFKLIPNIKNINLRKVKKLRLELVSKPKNISNERIVPSEVEFIIIN